MVLVPRRAGRPDRDELWRFARPWWKREVGLPIVEGDHDDGPFNRSAALNRAAELAGDWSVAVLIDADVLVNPDAVTSAIAVATETGAMVVAFTDRWHIGPVATNRILAGWSGNWRPHSRRIVVESVSSAVVVRRDLWERVGGFDEAFVGWGWEDVAFRVACEAVSARPIVRIGATLWHLHHQVSGGNNPDEPTFVANRERGELYRAHQWDPDAIAALRATVSV